MVFNDSSGQQGIVQDCDWWAGTNGVTYPIADKVRNANASVERISARILRNTYGDSFVDDNSTDFYIVYTDLVAGEDNIALEVGHLVLERVRIKDRQGVWKTLELVSRREIADEELDARGEPTKCYRAGQSLLWAPIPDYSVDEGVELEYQKGMSLFATTGTDDKVPGFNANYHRLVALDMASDYCAIKDQKRYKAIKTEIERMEADLDNYYQKRNRTKQRKLTFRRRNSHIIL